MKKERKENAAIKRMPRKYYHLCTDGWKEGKLFNNHEQFKAGMSTMALAAKNYDVKIVAFTLMPNHIHLLLNATGETCLEIFWLLRQRINNRLVKDGFGRLPENYGMKLIPIDDRKSLQSHILYLTRNAYEKNYCVPGGYPWGTEYLYFSVASDFIRGTKIELLKDCDVRKILESRQKLPKDWEIHPDLGVLPRNYIHMDEVKTLFGSPKTYMTRLVKDYESFVFVSRSLEEDFDLSRPEAEDLLYGKMRVLFPGKQLRELLPEEKGRLAVWLNKQYQVPTDILSCILHMPERVVSQFIGSKDFGFRKQ